MEEGLQWPVGHRGGRGVAALSPICQASSAPSPELLTSDKVDQALVAKRPGEWPADQQVEPPGHIQFVARQPQLKARSSPPFKLFLLTAAPL